MDLDCLPVVQVGGYKKIDLSKYIDNSSKDFNLETNKDQIQEITVGQFSDDHKSNELKKHLRSMGVKVVWIVPFKDGTRIELKKVVDEIKWMLSLTDTILIAHFHFQLINSPREFYSPMLPSNKK